MMLNIKCWEYEYESLESDNNCIVFDASLHSCFSLVVLGCYIKIIYELLTMAAHQLLGTNDACTMINQ